MLRWETELEATNEAVQANIEKRQDSKKNRLEYPFILPIESNTNAAYIDDVGDRVEKVVMD